MTEGFSNVILKGIDEGIAGAISKESRSFEIISAAIAERFPKQILEIIVDGILKIIIDEISKELVIELSKQI